MDFSILSNAEQLLFDALQILKTKTTYFTDADSISGDGDLGVNIDIVCDAISNKSALTEGITSWHDWGPYLANLINEAAPSSFLTLISKSLKEASIDWPENERITRKNFTETLLLSRTAMMKFGKVAVGDKTVLDVLSPVTDFALSSDENIPFGEFLDGISEVAHQGLQSTKNMQAKKGRSRWNPKISMGYQDAGALVLYELIESFRFIIRNEESK